MPGLKSAYKEPLFQKVFEKKDRSGRVTKSITIEVGSFDFPADDSKPARSGNFIKIKQVKVAFGSRPGSVSWVTIDPMNLQIKKALAVAYIVAEGGAVPAEYEDADLE